MSNSAALYMMHGEGKLLTEGLRTRDAHFMEWFAELRPEVRWLAVSRPEPAPRLYADRAIARTRRRPRLPDGVTFHSPQVWTGNVFGDRRNWWLTSIRYLDLALDVDVWVVWNPLVALREEWWSYGGLVLFDMLDDWLIHAGFAAIRGPVAESYQRLAARADYITCNSRGTLSRARDLGRPDAHYLPNGCDPHRFSTTHTPTGGHATVGYVGKLGHRLDLDLIRSASSALPDCTFLFAGPILDHRYVRPMKQLPNVRLIGDVHYADYPHLLESFDCAWIPHRTDPAADIGGDVLKVYEFRAAGLPTFMTPVQSEGATLPGVRVLAGSSLIRAMARLLASNSDRPRRESTAIPHETTWQYKAEWLLTQMGFGRSLYSP